jgi:hypothetical protein
MSITERPEKRLESSVRPHASTDPTRGRPPRAPANGVRAGAGAGVSHALAVGSLPVGGTAWLRNLASQDWLTVGYLVTLLGALVLGKGPNRAACIARVSVDLAVFLFIVALVRGQLLRWGSSAASLVYRTAVIGVILSSFFQLREILPAVSPWTDDARIYAFDLRIFGFEPSVVFDRYVTPLTTEWFAFFYFLYFLILSVHVLPMVYWQRDVDLLGRFATGLLLVFCVAHIAYMIVPGFGPYWYLKGTFQHELTGGTFWRLVREAVEAGGAQKDIFPSLHTAAPTYFAIFAFRHRRRLPFQFWWPVISFLATQIIIATMFLRWHYLIDVIAGVTLAATASVFGQRIADWERAKRERLGLHPAWTPLVYPWSRASDD